MKALAKFMPSVRRLFCCAYVDLHNVPLGCLVLVDVDEPYCDGLAPGLSDLLILIEVFGCFDPSKLECQHGRPAFPPLQAAQWCVPPIRLCLWNTAR